MCINRIVILILGIIIVGVIVLLYNNNKEGYLSSYFKEYKKDEIQIKENNPFDNVLISDYKYNTDKKEAIQDYTPEIENKINETIKQSILEQNKDNSDMIYMFADDKNNFEFEQNLRQFNSNPSTTIPNNQDNFLSFCYGKLYSEKPLTIY
jgi:FtsZ-interacting cell division protein ZipA